MAAPVKNLVRKLRKDEGLTQQDLAGQLGVSRQTVNAIENERYDPSLSLALRMARIFSLPVETIFTDET